MYQNYSMFLCQLIWQSVLITSTVSMATEQENVSLYQYIVIHNQHLLLPTPLSHTMHKRIHCIVLGLHENSIFCSKDLAISHRFGSIAYAITVVIEVLHMYAAIFIYTFMCRYMYIYIYMYTSIVFPRRWSRSGKACRTFACRSTQARRDFSCFGNRHTAHKGPSWLLSLPIGQLGCLSVCLSVCLAPSLSVCLLVSQPNEHVELSRVEWAVAAFPLTDRWLPVLEPGT